MKLTEDTPVTKSFAIVKSVKDFRHYPLESISKLAQIARHLKLVDWSCRSDKYGYKVEPRAGARMQHIDALSRIPYVTAIVSSHEEIRLPQERDVVFNAIR